MIKVGLTGGYACGKSFVASELERLGCHLIYADRLGHSVLERGGRAYEAAVHLFGPGVLNSDSTIDRKKLASIVFGNPELLKKLESIVHPAVFELEEQMLSAFAAADLSGITVVEAAILIEAGRHNVYDRLIVTACSPATQVNRAMRRDGVTREEALSRIAKQMPLAEKEKLADYVINTDSDKEATIRNVGEVYRDLKKLADSEF